jgi:hypothetical protein
MRLEGAGSWAVAAQQDEVGEHARRIEMADEGEQLRFRPGRRQFVDEEADAQRSP